MTAARRRWRSALDGVLFVSILVLGSSLPASAAPERLASAQDRHICSCASEGAAAIPALRLTAPQPESSSPDPFDTEDDDDGGDDGNDGDGLTIAIAVTSSHDHADCASGWVLDQPGVNPLLSVSSDSHALRAPPQ